MPIFGGLGEISPNNVTYRPDPPKGPLQGNTSFEP